MVKPDRDWDDWRNGLEWVSDVLHVLFSYKANDIVHESCPPIIYGFLSFPALFTILVLGPFYEWGYKFLYN